MTDIDRLYHKIKSRWNFRRQQADATCEELKFLVELLDIMEADDFGKDTDVPTKWISVKDRLPEDGATVLISTPKGRMRVARVTVPYQRISKKYDTLEAWWWMEGFDRSLKATHWMPLPELPEDGDSNDEA